MQFESVPSNELVLKNVGSSIDTTTGTLTMGSSLGVFTVPASGIPPNKLFSVRGELYGLPTTVSLLTYPTIHLYFRILSETLKMK